MTARLFDEPDFRGAVIDRLGRDWNDNGAVISPRADFDVCNRDAYREAKGTRQRDRSREPMESGYYDLARYRATIMRAVERCDDGALAIDLGCGDGRGVDMLLAAPRTKVIAIDFNEHALTNLWNALDADSRQRVVPVCASVDRPIHLESDADLILLLEVLSTLADPGAVLNMAATMLRPGGMLILSDPSINGQFVHALLNQDWDNLSGILTRRIYADSVGDRRVELYLRSPEELEQIANQAGLHMISYEQYPASRALLLHAMKQAGAIQANSQLIRDMVEHDVVGISRLNVLTLQKLHSGELR